MEIFGKQVLVIVILLVTVQQFVSIAGEPDFKKALEIVENAKEQPGNIDYGTFCEAMGSGASKLGCQIKAMDDVWLLVCLTSEDCEFKLNVELKALNEIRQANLTVLPYCQTIINGLKCGAKGSKDVTCSGYLVEWIPADQGMMKSLRIYILYNTVNILVDSVRNFQPQQQARLKTGDDLDKIAKFMIPPDVFEDGYKRICDLQGFFMKTGGFLIADPEGVQVNTTLTDTCYDKNMYPTTEKVIEGLVEMIAGITM